MTSKDMATVNLINAWMLYANQYSMQNGIKIGEDISINSIVKNIWKSIGNNIFDLIELGGIDNTNIGTDALALKRIIVKHLRENGFYDTSVKENTS